MEEIVVMLCNLFDLVKLSTYSYELMNIFYNKLMLMNIVTIVLVNWGHKANLRLVVFGL